MVYKKGDPRRAENYRPICLIWTLVKMSAAWLCRHLSSKTPQHSFIHLCQHGGLANHRCGDHIHDLVASMLQIKGRLYHLYIDLNKANNSVPLQALLRTLEGYGLPKQLIASIQRLYDDAHHHSLVQGLPIRGNLQERVVRQGFPLSTLLFTICLNLMFSYLDTTIQWGSEKSINAFVDDILFRARSIKDVKAVFKAFDGFAKETGLDMNVNKTELHAKRGTAQTETRPRHRASIATWDSLGNPHQYLGVLFYTTGHEHRILDYVKSEIRSFFVNLAPLGLTATELIMLRNRQLQPTIAYRLLASPLSERSSTQWSSAYGKT